MPCNMSKWTRRDLLKTSTALAAGVLFAEPLKAAAPPPSAVTPALIEAARKEGKVSFYTAIELNVAERLGKVFEAKYPGIAVRIERSGAERIFQRIAQEQSSRINRGRRRQQHRSRALSRLEKERLARALSSPKMSPSIIPRIRSIRTECTRPRAPGWRSSATTPIW